jgi:hypothetical protein
MKKWIARSWRELAWSRQLVLLLLLLLLLLMLRKLRLYQW